MAPTTKVSASIIDSAASSLVAVVVELTELAPDPRACSSHAFIITQGNHSLAMVPSISFSFLH